MNEEDLRQLIKNIKEAEFVILDKMKIFNKLKHDVDVTKTSIMSNIASEDGADGKPKYSNQTKRDAAFLVQTSESSEYTKALLDIDNSGYELDALRIELQDLKYNFRMQEILSRI